MNRDALDEFFAKAEDVLDHWEPSDDAMVARVADEDADLPLADSYYAQGAQRWGTFEWFIGESWARPRHWMDLDSAMWGRSFIEVGPEGLSLVPVTRWMEFAVPHVPRIETGGLSILQEWVDESVTSRREQELDALYSLVDFERYWITEECPQRPAPSADDVIVPRLSTDADAARDPWRWDRKRNTGPRERRGLDGRFRR